MTSLEQNIAQEPEEWRPLLCGYYEASNLGRIRRSAIGQRTRSGHILKQQTSNKYNHIMLSLGQRRIKQFYVHVLVAEAFLGPKKDGDEVNHIDLNKRNNRSDNLEYLNRLGNVAHAISNGHYAHGVKHGMAKLSEDDVRAILASKGALTRNQLAEKYGVHEGHVKAIWSRRVWRHVVCLD